MSQIFNQSTNHRSWWNGLVTNLQPINQSPLMVERACHKSSTNQPITAHGGTGLSQIFNQSTNHRSWWNGLVTNLQSINQSPLMVERAVTNLQPINQSPLMVERACHKSSTNQPITAHGGTGLSQIFNQSTNHRSWWNGLVTNLQPINQSPLMVERACHKSSTNQPITAHGGTGLSQIFNQSTNHRSWWNGLVTNLQSTNQSINGDFVEDNQYGGWPVVKDGSDHLFRILSSMEYLQIRTCPDTGVTTSLGSYRLWNTYRFGLVQIQE